MAEDVVAGTGTSVPAAPSPAPSPAFEATSRRSLLPRISPRRGSARQSMHPELEPLLRTVKQFHPKADVKILEAAYERAAYLHRDQVRRSGDPYITHPLAVATILAELGMTPPTLAAALLHDTVEDTEYSLDALREDFGDEVAALVDGVTKLDKVKYGQANGKLLAQAEFARFIEDNLPDIVQPAAADMLRIALTLQVKKDAAYASDLRLDNGQTQFRYEETIRGTTKAGDLLIPDSFTLNIPVFLGGPRLTVTARLRYRIQEQKLVIGYELVRPQHVRLAEVTRVTSEIAKKLEGFTVFVGRR